MLCVHGNPTWSYLWRTVLAAATDPANPWRVVAVDQLDMGFSERTGLTRRLADRVRDLAAQWRKLLADMTIEDLDAPAAFPWPADAGRSAADTALWVTVELTKNAAEIGQLRLLRAGRG